MFRSTARARDFSLVQKAQTLCVIVRSLIVADVGPAGFISLHVSDIHTEL